MTKMQRIALLQTLLIYYPENKTGIWEWYQSKLTKLPDFVSNEE